MFRSDPRDGFLVLDEHLKGDKDAVLVIPTNIQRRLDGEAVMGAGLALAAARRWPSLPREYGDALRRGDEIIRIGNALLFPTKSDWRKPSDLELIRISCVWLVAIAPSFAGDILMPRVGCGLGGLNWRHQVLPLLIRELQPIRDRIVLVGA